MVAGSLVGQLVWAEATNRPDALALRAQADRWAGAGAWASALTAYEEIVRNDPALVPTLAPVMARLAVQGKQAESAVRWAGVSLAASWLRPSVLAKAGRVSGVACSVSF